VIAGASRRAVVRPSYLVERASSRLMASLMRTSRLDIVILPLEIVRNATRRMDILRPPTGTSVRHHMCGANDICVTASSIWRLGLH